MRWRKCGRGIEGVSSRSNSDGLQRRRDKRPPAAIDAIAIVDLAAAAQQLRDQTVRPGVGQEQQHFSVTEAVDRAKNGPKSQRTETAAAAHDMTDATGCHPPRVADAHWRDRFSRFRIA